MKSYCGGDRHEGYRGGQVLMLHEVAKLCHKGGKAEGYGSDQVLSTIELTRIQITRASILMTKLAQGDKLGES